MIKRTIVPLLLLMCVAGAPVLRAQAPPTKPQGVIIQRILVKVNGDILTQKELEQRQSQALRDQGKGDLSGDALYKALEDITPDLLVNSIDELLIVQRGRELGYHLSDEQFASSLERIKKENNLDDAGFKLALQQEGLSLDDLRQTLDRQYVVNTVQQREILGRMSLTEEEARQYYDKHPDEFMKPATVMLRELLIVVPAAPASGGQSQLFAQTADEAAKQKIVALHDRAVAGEDFEKLIAEASQAVSKSKGGLIGPVNLAEMSTGIRDAIEKMKPGDFTAPIRTTAGYQILKLETRSAAERLPFDGVRDDIAQKVGEARLDVEMSKYLRQLRTQALIEWKRDDLRQMYEKKLAEKG